MKITTTITKVTALYLILTQNAYALFDKATATPKGLSNNASIIEVIKAFFVEAFTVGAIILGAAGSAWLAWIAISEVNEARNGRKEWGGVIVTIVSGAGIYALVAYLLATAMGYTK